MSRRSGSAVLAAVLALIGCASDAPLVTPSPGYPCGMAGIPCANGACCPQGYTCGGAFPAIGCPADQCCDVGNELLTARRPVRQTAPASQ